ncbi:MAG: TolC family protein [Paludisphaera borealis]|uniref:TolC family protein n=1 Tax=Paludisphaera borealis TaxID=1387353 RepID=UPI00284114A4|nr:TolC family protein [Paludisphaera borealis]MDR3621150.1 TolC family protein [Paludisphaera borealis]
MKRRISDLRSTWFRVLGPLVAWSIVATASAQDASSGSGKLIERPNLGPIAPGSLDSNLPPSGSLQPNPFSIDPGIIGGRRRTGRIPRPGARGFSESNVSGPPALPDPLPGVAPPEPSDGPPVGDISDLVNQDGPADGLTLDAALDRLKTANLDVLALKYELPQAQADILTAGLRANPLLYFDTQFIPYGTFNTRLPGGPTQYDVNITYPLDVSHKRQARVAVACAAKRVLEAQFADVARRQIANVYRSFVDLQSARIGLRALETLIQQQEDVLKQVRRGAGPKKKSALEAEKLEIELAKSRAGLNDARDSLADAQEALGLLLALPPDETERLEPRGRLRAPHPPLPSRDDMIRAAQANRPDLAAARLGIRRADSEVRLARANRLDDVYLFYDPFTYQDNHPFQAASARSWALGVTFPVPLFNRNQGNISKAQSNLGQSHAEVTALERRLASEVRQAYREFVAARESLILVERSVLPRARFALDQAVSRFLAGDLEVGDYLDELEDDADSARLYRDAVFRYRRSMLDINTAVGVRLMP